MDNKINFVELLIIGDELLNGEVLDINTKFLCSELSAMDIEVGKVTYLPDNIELIVAAIEASKARIVLTSGGLGPTADDITRNAVASALNVELVKDDASVKKLELHAKSRGRPDYSISLRQAQFPANAEVLENSEGTANGFKAEHIICLPGVPSELRSMWRNSVRNITVSSFTDVKKQYRASFTLFGRSEAGIGEMLEEKIQGLKVGVRYRPSFPELHVCLSSESAEDLAAGKTALLSSVDSDCVLGDRELKLVELIHELLLKSGRSVAVAESCTGGLLGSKLSSQPGSSEYFLGGVIAYSNKTKKELLGVTQVVLSEYGAVSAQTAAAMAEGVRSKFRSFYGVSVTGIAGPGGGTEDKAVGTVWLGISTSERTHTCLLNFPSERERVRLYSTFAVLDIIRRDILGLNLPSRLGNR